MRRKVWPVQGVHLYLDTSDPPATLGMLSERNHQSGACSNISPLPAEVQRVTIFSCGLQTGAPQPAAAKALVAFLTTANARAVMQKHGLETA